MISLSAFLVVGAILFALGLFVALMKRTAVVVLMGIELMLNAANLNLVAFAAYLDRLSGQVFALFVIALAAGEAAVGLAIILSLFRSRATVQVDDIDLLKG